MFYIFLWCTSWFFVGTFVFNSAWSLIKVSLTFFKMNTLTIEHFLTKIYCSPVISKFFFMCAYTRFFTWGLIICKCTTLMNITFINWQTLTILHCFIISTFLLFVRTSSNCILWWLIELFKKVVFYVWFEMFLIIWLLKITLFNIE